MGDGDSIRRETAEISSILSPKTGNHVIDSSSTGWTDEKHCTFLNSMEASFVDQLYTNQYMSKDLPSWLSRWRKRVRSSESDQGKIIHKGCSEKPNLVTAEAETHTEVKIESVPLGSNPWVRRLRSIPTVNEAHSSPLLEGQSKKYSEATCMEKLPNECQNSVQDFVAGNREVSDQNFVGDELDTGESRVCKKRKLSSDVAPMNDQVVPSKNASLAPNINADHAYLDKEYAESSHGKFEQH